MRLFVAIRFPTAIAAAASRVLPEALPAVRPVREELLHLTLAFLGETPDERLGDVTQAIAIASRAVPPFRVSLAAVGQFPPRRGDAAIFLSIADGAEAAGLLARSVRAELARAGLAFDAKPFVAHVTLGRLRAGAAPEQRAAAIAAVGALAPTALSFVAEQVEVMRSVLSPPGPRYSALASARLGEERRDHAGGVGGAGARGA
ncbi:MAG: RNA 2',3'-cyclic phosphodiesterase [Chloroflexi bacterium]|nr:RNA 2',3'-cyclic phosphodiesterase [Chloroflexota bacterium]